MSCNEWDKANDADKELFKTYEEFEPVGIEWWLQNTIGFCFKIYNCPFCGSELNENGCTK